MASWLHSNENGFTEFQNWKWESHLAEAAVHSIEPPFNRPIWVSEPSIHPHINPST